MADTMAADPKVAQAFMLKVWPGAVARVKQEVADMQAIADREQPGTRIEPWDYLYFAEKVRKAKYDLDEAELKPYFELNNMVSAALVVGRAALRHGVQGNHGHGSGLSSRRPRLGSDRQEHGQASRAVLPG